MKIIVAQEKHGDRYLNATTDEALAASCVKLLKERLEQGWYDPGNPPEAKDVLTPEQIDLLPTESLRIAEANKCRSYLKELKYWERDVEFEKQVKQIVQSDVVDAKQAWRLLQSRNGEYEAVNIENVE